MEQKQVLTIQVMGFQEILEIKANTQTFFKMFTDFIFF